MHWSEVWSERMIGTEVKVYSRSQKKWLDGTICSFPEGKFDHCKAVAVKYKTSGNTTFVPTTLPLGERIRPQKPLSEENDVSSDVSSDFAFIDGEFC